jgi:hypothetical protein
MAKQEATVGQRRRIYETKVMDEHVCGIEKACQREIDQCCGCSGQPGASEGNTSAPLALIQKPQSTEPHPPMSQIHSSCVCRPDRKDASVWHAHGEAPALQPQASKQLTTG